VKQRLFLRHEAIALLNRLAEERPAHVVSSKGRHVTDLFVKMVDFDDFVVELNDLCYKVDGGDA